MQRAIQSDHADDDRTGDDFLKIGTDSAVNQKMQNEVEKKCAQYCARVAPFAPKNVRPAKNHCADHLQLEAQRDARRLDRLDAGNVDQRGETEEDAAGEERALQN